MASDGTSSGTVVSSWTSTTGTLTLNAPSAANEPVLLTPAVNGLPAVRFLGDDWVTDLEDFGMDDGTNNHDVTIFLVLQDFASGHEGVTNAGSFRGFFGISRDFNVSNDPGFRFNNGYADFSPAGGDTGLVTGGFHLVEARHISGGTHNDTVFLANDAVPSSKVVNNPGNTVSFANGSGIVIGSRFNGAGGGGAVNGLAANASIAEVIVYGGAQLGSADQAAIASYLTSKYNVVPVELSTFTIE